MKRKRLSKSQRTLAPKPEDKPGVTITTELASSLVLCPFCLHAGYVSSFQTTLKSGKPSKKCTCPECHLGMRYDSLTKNMTASEYADWIFYYPYYEFWARQGKAGVHDKWYQRLRELGLAHEFWTRYKESKKSIGPSYADEMNRMGEEYAAAWNRGADRPDDL